MKDVNEETQILHNEIESTLLDKDMFLLGDHVENKDYLNDYVVLQEYCKEKKVKEIFLNKHMNFFFFINFVCFFVIITFPVKGIVDIFVFITYIEENDENVIQNMMNKFEELNINGPDNLELNYEKKNNKTSKVT